MTDYATENKEVLVTKRLLYPLVFTFVCLALLVLSTRAMSSVSLHTGANSGTGATERLQGWASWFTAQSVTTPTTVYLPIVLKNWLAAPLMPR